jgi:pimeloyl-ACP methyl ester carboxylesterase
MGSLIALQAAAAAPERTTRLVLIGASYPMKVSDALLATAREAPQRAMAMVNAWSISTTASKPGFHGPGNWLHGGNLALMRRVQAGTPGANVFLHDFDTCNRYAGGLEAAARVSCPAALILGRADQMTPPRAARDIVAALKARVFDVAAGHLQPAEAPDATLAALRAALA